MAKFRTVYGMAAFGGLLYALTRQHRRLMTGAWPRHGSPDTVAPRGDAAAGSGGQLLLPGISEPCNGVSTCRRMG